MDIIFHLLHYHSLYLCLQFRTDLFFISSLTFSNSVWICRPAIHQAGEDLAVYPVGPLQLYRRGSKQIILGRVTRHCCTGCSRFLSPIVQIPFSFLEGLHQCGGSTTRAVVRLRAFQTVNRCEYIRPRYLLLKIPDGKSCDFQLNLLFSSDSVSSRCLEPNVIAQTDSVSGEKLRFNTGRFTRATSQISLVGRTRVFVAW